MHANSQQRREPMQPAVVVIPMLTMVFICTLGYLYADRQFKHLESVLATSAAGIYNEFKHPENNISVASQKPAENAASIMGPTNGHGLAVEARHSRNAINVLFGLSGNATGMWAEVEVALRSVLLNGHPGIPLDIWFVCDTLATHHAKTLFDGQKLAGSTWPQQITIRVIDVSAYITIWKERIYEATKIASFKTVPDAGVYHSIGTYFRFFCHTVLPATAKHVVYLEPDVVILGDLYDVWRARNSSNILQYGLSRCTGFMLITVQRLSEFWELLGPAIQVHRDENDGDTPELTGTPSVDQNMVRLLQTRYPDIVNTIRQPGWDLTLADGGWKFANNLRDYAQYSSKLGGDDETLTTPKMMHFNGGGGSDTPYFDSYLKANDLKSIGDSEAWSEWRLALYYVRMPWHWALSLGNAKVSPGVGYQLKVEFSVAADPTSAV